MKREQLVTIDAFLETHFSRTLPVNEENILPFASGGRISDAFLIKSGDLYVS